jgi:aldose 1-epimerase
MSVECVALKDPNSSATATVAAGYGFNCFQFTVARGGRTIDILWSAADFAAGTARASGSGIPILFPFPGRIAGGLFYWDGRAYRVPQGDDRGNAIHGFVLNRAWRVVERSDSRVVGEFHASRDDAQLLKAWPADFRIRATYTLQDETLSCRLHVENPDTRPLPCGLGTHPYFRVPLGGAHSDGCIVTLPITEQWELTQLLPTGRRMPLPNAAAFHRGMAFGMMKLDNVFTGLQRQGERYATTVFDPHSQVRVTQTFDRIFRECVVYTPPHRQAVCIEPYTCVPGAIELAARGIDAGLRMVPPGGSFTANVDIEVR